MTFEKNGGVVTSWTITTYSPVIEEQKVTMMYDNVLLLSSHDISEIILIEDINPM